MDEYIWGLIDSWVAEQSPVSASAPAEVVEDDPEPERQDEPVWRVVFEDVPRNVRVRACDGFVDEWEQYALYVHCSTLEYWEFEKPLGRFGAVQRRGVCMQAAPGIKGYRYSGQEVVAHPLDDVLGRLLDRVNAVLGTSFNSWLLNWYRPRGLGGSSGDYLSAHSDDEKELSKGVDGLTVFGLTLTDNPACLRVLRFDSKTSPGRRADLLTAPGQAYVMERDCQRHYTHAVPRALSVPGSRISLTARRFRVSSG